MPVGWLSGAGQDEASPHIGEGGDQRVDIRVAVQRCGGQAQPFRAAWHRGVVDRLDIDPVALQQLVAGSLAQCRVADQYWDNMARRRHDRQAGRGETALECGGAFLVAIAFGLARFKMADRGLGAGGDRRRQ